MTDEERINIHGSVEQICTLLGLKSSYVARLEIEPDNVVVVLFKGRDGRCEGPKYIDSAGEAAIERLSFEVLA